MAETSEDPDEVERTYRYAILISLAGAEAQRRFDPTSFEEQHAESDEERARDVLWRLGYPPEGMQRIDAALRNEVKVFVTAHWGEIELVAKALLEKQVMTGEELYKVLEAAQ